MEVTIVDNPLDKAEANRTLDAHLEYICGNISREEWGKFPRKQWLIFDGTSPCNEFCVVDNRAGECFIETFRTLDGAMLYLCDCHMSTSYQSEWDYCGAVMDHGGFDKKDEGFGYSEKEKKEYVVKCPIYLDQAAGGPKFVFGYAKCLDICGTDEIFTTDIKEAIRFSSLQEACNAGKELLGRTFVKEHNVVLFEDELNGKDMT